MSNTSIRVVLISGAGRGIGRRLLEVLVARPNHHVIAANRDITGTISQSLLELPTAPGSKIILLKIDATSPTDALAGANELQSQGVHHLDTVIANAGIYLGTPLVRDLSISDLQKHLETNVFGVVRLYQGLRGLLLNAERPLWVTIGSSGGWLENQYPRADAAYGPAKAAVHWLTKRVDGEEEKIAAIVIEPGWVQTDMGNLGAQWAGMDRADLTVEASVDGINQVLDIATKASHGGRMWGQDGNQKAW